MMYPSLPVAQRALESSSLRRRSDGAVVAGWPAAIATMNQACVPLPRIAVPPNRPFPGGQHSNLPRFYRHISGARRGVHIALPAPVPLPWMGGCELSFVCQQYTKTANLRKNLLSQPVLR